MPKKDCELLRVRHLFILVILLAGLLSGRPAIASELLIIANKSVKEGSVSAAMLKSFFLRKRTSWPSGEKVVPINAKEGSDLRQAFRERVLKMTKADENAYWNDQKIRKGIKKPAEIKSMIKAVFSVKGSIGYVFGSDLKSKVVKVLATF